jgi:hypothetical protein
LIFFSCGIFKTHHKKELIDFENNQIPKNVLKLNGYYYTELERNANENDRIKEKIKYLSVFFIYKDGFAINISGIDGITNYYCADKKNYGNSYENAHQTVILMLKAQNSNDKRIKKNCGFKSNDINQKSLVAIDNDKIKIQTYRIERQNPEKDSFNSAYLWEINGIIKTDSTFVIQNEKEYRTNESTTEMRVFKFRETEQKPNIGNYFKKNKKRFK